MKKALVICMVSMISLSCVPNEEAGSSAIDEDSVFIDVRTAEEFATGHIEAAINIPYTEIAEKIAGHVENKEEQITLYCRSGRRSAIAKSTLEAMGYTHVTDAGAYTTLKKQMQQAEAQP